VLHLGERHNSGCIGGVSGSHRAPVSWSVFMCGMAAQLS
jgi:hypothetical protein